MAMTLDELLRADTEEDALEFLLTELAAADPPWPVTDYAPGDPGLLMLRVFARALAEHVAVVRDVAAGGLLDEAAKLANGGWLTLLVKSWFELDRTAAVFARAKFRLTCSASGGPYTITPGQLWARATATGKLYNVANTANETLNTGGTLDLEWRAESPGAAYNLALGAGVELVTPLPGVSLATVETAPGSGSCMAVAGRDEEANAPLVARARARWATIGLQKTKDAYAFLATNVRLADGAPDPAAAGVSKVLVDDTNPRGPGTVDVYLAGASGAVTDAPTIAAVDAYMQPRQALTADLDVKGAVNDAVAVAATVYHTGAAPTTELAALLAAYQAELAIGDGLGAGTVYRAQLIELLMTPAGVRNVVLSTPAADVVPAKGHIAQLSYVLGGTITFVAAT